jgi:DeoR family suf operon transcriptional repressor
MRTTAAFQVAPTRPFGHKGPRADILLALKQHAALTAKDLTARLELSLNAVRHHLKELEAEGVIEYIREHRGVGAPAYSYRLSSEGHALFPRRYQETLTGILALVEEREGREAAVGMLEAHFDALALKLEGRLAGGSGAARLEIVAQALAEEGFMPEWRVAGPESGVLLEHNCAIHAVAERYPEICAAERLFLEKVLSAAVDRRAHILGGCTACEYHVQFEPAQARGPVVQITPRGSRLGEEA